jgi:hypothetical protein
VDDVDAIGGEAHFLEEFFGLGAVGGEAGGAFEEEADDALVEPAGVEDVAAVDEDGVGEAEEA